LLAKGSSSLLTLEKPILKGEHYKNFQKGGAYVGKSDGSAHTMPVSRFYFLRWRRRKNAYGMLSYQMVVKMIFPRIKTENIRSLGLNRARSLL
tara:strand:+ start:301 stop:579 length:279 start_codon:yes stop_codon:yes gene_type:complete